MSAYWKTIDFEFLFSPPAKRSSIVRKKRNENKTNFPTNHFFRTSDVWWPLRTELTKIYFLNFKLTFRIIVFAFFSMALRLSPFPGFNVTM